MWQDLTARTLHLSTLHMHNSSIRKVERCDYFFRYCPSCECVRILMTCVICHTVFSGNTKRGIHILQNALKVGAKPKELLEAALKSMHAGKTLFCPEDKENVPCEYSHIGCPSFFFNIHAETQI